MRDEDLLTRDEDLRIEREREDAVMEAAKREEDLEIDRLMTDEIRQDALNEQILREMGKETRELLERLDASERKEFLELVRKEKIRLKEAREYLLNRI